MAFLSNNWALVVTALFVILGLVLSGRRLLWFKWLNEVAFFAWHNAEEKGLIEGWEGSQKFLYYFDLWQAEYRKKFLSEPDEKTFVQFRDKATELSIKEKVIAQVVPK